MTQTTALIIFLAAGVASGTILIVTIGREMERKFPELGDLPAALLTIFFVAAIGYGVAKIRQIESGRTSSVMQEEDRGR